MEKLKNFFKTSGKEKITALLFLVIIFGMFFGLAANYYNLGSGFITGYRNTVPTGAPYVDRIKGAISAADTAINESAFRRSDYVEIYGLAQLLMGKNVITDYNYGALYKTSFDQITFAVGEKYVDDSCAATYDLVNALISKDIDFLYVQLPFKLPPDEYDINPQLPANVKDYSNKNADAFVDNLDAANVKTYDLRRDFWSLPASQNELFFDTDHHWTIPAAFEATRLIARHLNENYEMEIDESIYDISKYKQVLYENSYLGSMGRRVGQLYGGLDDFILITPDFPTDYTLTQISGEHSEDFNGTFDEAIIEWHYIDSPDVSSNKYAAYHGDYQELRFVNHLTENNKKILIIKDSFGIPVYSFLSLGIKEVRAIDLRLFEANVAEYAAAYDPDLVILMYNADSFTYPMFDFNMAQ